MSGQEGRFAMHYELNKSMFFWHWLVPQHGTGRALTKAGAKRAAEALIARLKKLRRRSSKPARKGDQTARQRIDFAKMAALPVETVISTVSLTRRSITPTL